MKSDTASGIKVNCSKRHTADNRAERKPLTIFSESSNKYSEDSSYSEKESCTSNVNSRRSRKIKDVKLLRLLEAFFELDPEWKKETMDFLCSFLNLTNLQIYKWGYDQKRRISHKKGIRSKIKDKNMKKYTYSNSISTVDYNSMVSELFSENEKTTDELNVDIKLRFEFLRDEYLNKSPTKDKNSLRGDVKASTLENRRIEDLF
jgi:hypothetical protein